MIWHADLQKYATLTELNFPTSKAVSKCIKVSRSDSDSVVIVQNDKSTAKQSIDNVEPETLWMTAMTDIYS